MKIANLKEVSELAVICGKQIIPDEDEFAMRIYADYGTNSLYGRCSTGLWIPEEPDDEEKLAYIYYAEDKTTQKRIRELFEKKNPHYTQRDCELYAECAGRCLAEYNESGSTNDKAAFERCMAKAKKKADILRSWYGIEPPDIVHIAHDTMERQMKIIEGRK